MFRRLRERRAMAPAMRYPVLGAIALLIMLRVVHLHKGSAEAARSIVAASGGAMTAQQVGQWLARQGVQNITAQTLRSLSIDQDDDGFNAAELQRVADFFDEYASASAELIELGGDAPISSVFRHVLALDMCLLALLFLCLWSEMEAVQRERDELKRRVFGRRLQGATSSVVAGVRMRKLQEKIDAKTAAISDLRTQSGQQYASMVEESDRLQSELQKVGRQGRQQAEHFAANVQDMEENNGRWFIQLVRMFPQGVLGLAAETADRNLVEAASNTENLRRLAGLTPQAEIPHEQRIPVANGVVLAGDAGGGKTIVTLAGGHMGMYSVLPPSRLQQGLKGAQGYPSDCQDLLDPDRALLCKRFNSASPEHCRDLAKELRVQMALAEHQGIARFHLVIETHDDVFMIMRKVRGADLFGTAAQSEASCKGIIRRVADALRHTHDHGVIHNDIKPENVVLSDDHRDVAIIDYGLACLEREKDTRRPCRDRYRPPEHEAPIDDGTTPRPSTAADVYRLGLTLFWLLAAEDAHGRSGRLFRHEKTSKSQLSDMDWVRGRIARARTCRGEPFPEEVQDLLRALLHPTPGERPSAARLLEHEWFDVEVRSA